MTKVRSFCRVSISGPGSLTEVAVTAVFIVVGAVIANILTCANAAVATISCPTRCPVGCVCAGHATATSANSTGCHVSCEGAGLVGVPASTELPPSGVLSLDLSRNSLGPSLAAVAFERKLSIQLIELKIRECELETIDDVFGSADDDVKNISPDDWRSLRSLDLSGNHLARLRSDTFLHASGLLHLDVSDNRLTNIEPRAFEGLVSLTRLDLRQNRLENLYASSFVGLAGLRYLRLDDNRISSIEVDAFAGLEQLVYLVIKGNPLGSGASSTASKTSRKLSTSAHNQHNIRFRFQSPFLSYVDMSECELHRIPRGLPRRSLRYLQLRRNRIESISRTDLEDCCTSVGILVLDENGLADIEPGAFHSSTPGIEQLWLNGNHLRAIPRPLPVGLRRLFVDGNRLEQLTSDDFPMSGTRLETLSLATNNITELSADAFSLLTELRSLDLSGNRLSHVATSTFADNRKLETLILSKNPLEVFERGAFDGLGQLHTLVLSNVPSLPSLSEIDERRPTRLDSETFRGLCRGSLHKLELDGSRGLIRDLMSADSKVLECLSNVTELSLLDADLETIRSDFAAIFQNLAVFRVSGTNWHCDRSLVWFAHFLLSFSSTTASPGPEQDNVRENRCASPPPVRGRAMTSLVDSELDRQPKLAVDNMATVSPKLMQPVVKHILPTPTATIASPPSGILPVNSTSGRRTAAATHHRKPEVSRTSHRGGRYSFDDRVDDILPEMEFGRSFDHSGSASGNASDRYVNPSKSSDHRPRPSNGVEHTSPLPTGPSSSASGFDHPRSTVDSGENPSISSRAKKSQDDVISGGGSGRTSSGNISVATIVAPVVGGTILLTVLILFAVVCIHRRCRPKRRELDVKVAGNTSSAPSSPGRRVQLAVRTLPTGCRSGAAAVTTEAVLSNSSTAIDCGGPVMVGSPSAGLLGLQARRDAKHEGPLRVYRWEDF